MGVDRSGKKLSKQPLVQLLEKIEGGWDTSVEMKSHVQQKAQPVTAVVDSRSIEELTKLMREKKGTTEQYLFACQNGTDEATCEMLSLLLQEKPVNMDKVVDKKNGGLTLVHILASKNKVQSLEFASMYNVKLDPVDSILSTPLMYAAASNCPEAVAFLLSKGVNTNAKDTWMKFPLLVALKNKHYNIAELLCAHRGIDVHLRGMKGNTALHILSSDGDLRGVQLLVEVGNASPLRRNNDEETVLHASLSHTQVVQYLCSKIDKKSLAKLVLNVNIAGQNVVHECTKHGYYDSLMTILKSVDYGALTATQLGTLLNTADKNGDTPLIIAAKNSDEKMVQFLCQCAEVSVNKVDSEGRTPLFIAAKHTKIVAMLTSVGGSFKPENSEKDRRDGTIFSCAKSMRMLLSILLSSTTSICIITIAAISIGFFANNISKSSDTIRKNYFEQILVHISHEMEGIAKGLTSTFLSPYFNVTEEQEIFDYTSPVFFSTYSLLPLVSSVYCTKLNGAQAGWSKATNNSVAYWYSNYQNQAMSSIWTVTDFKNYRDLDRYDLIEVNMTAKPVPEYVKNAKNATGSVWTLSYTNPEYQGYLFLTISKGFRDPTSNEFVGSCQFDTDTSFLNSYLKESATQKNSVLVVVEAQTGYLISSSDTSIRFFDETVGNVTTRLYGSNKKNPRMSAMLNTVRSRYGNNKFQSIKAKSKIYDTFSFDGKINALNIGSIRDGNGLEWILIEAFPMSNFYSRFYNALIVMICASVALLLQSGITSAILSGLFMRPINTLIVQAEAVKTLQLEQVQKSLKKKSLFSEISALQVAFESMTERLMMFRNFIPGHILAVIDAELDHKTPADSDVPDFQTESRGSFEQSRRSSMSKDIVDQALNSTLTYGNVTVMTIRLPEWDQHLEMHSVQEIDETSKELLSYFTDIVRISKGQFISITSSKAVVAWNTFIRHADHVSRACKAARSCIDALKQLHEKWKTQNLPLLDVSIGISTDNIWYGNMGTDRMKFFTLIGSAAKRSSEICNSAYSWNVRVMCDLNVVQAVQEEFQTRPLYMKADNNGEERVVVYELGAAKGTDSWIHEIENKNSSHWTTYNNAFTLLLNKKYDDAYEQFVRFLETNAHDFVTQNMLGICKAQKDGAETSVISDDLTESLVFDDRLATPRNFA